LLKQNKRLASARIEVAGLSKSWGTI